LITAAALGVKRALELTLIVPTTSKPLDAVTEELLEMVTLLKARVPELEIDDPLLKEIVPLDGLKFPLVPILRAPLTLKLLLVVTVALLAMVILLNVNVPELEIEAPLFNVIVPDEALKFALVPTLKTPPMDKPLEVVTLAELEIVKLLNTNNPELEITEPLPTVIVPAEGLKLPPMFTVKFPRTEKLLDVVTVAELAIAKLLYCNVPELEIEEPLSMVMVPLEGENVEPVPTLNAP